MKLTDPFPPPTGAQADQKRAGDGTLAYCPGPDRIAAACAKALPEFLRSVAWRVSERTHLPNAKTVINMLSKAELEKRGATAEEQVESLRKAVALRTGSATELAYPDREELPAAHGPYKLFVDETVAALVRVGKEPADAKAVAEGAAVKKGLDSTRDFRIRPKHRGLSKAEAEQELADWKARHAVVLRLIHVRRPKELQRETRSGSDSETAAWGVGPDLRKTGMETLKVSHRPRGPTPPRGGAGAGEPAAAGGPRAAGGGGGGCGGGLAKDWRAGIGGD